MNTNYESPSVKVIEVKIEQGFALSETTQSNSAQGFAGGNDNWFQ